MPDRRRVPPALRVGIDYGPLLLFFGASKVFDIFVATGVFMAAVTAAIVVSRVWTGRVSPMLWFTGAIVLVAYHPRVASVLAYDRYVTYGLRSALPVAAALILVALGILVVVRIARRAERA